jgi:hypothetical protein
MQKRIEILATVLEKCPGILEIFEGVGHPGIDSQKERLTSL